MIATFREVERGLARLLAMIVQDPGRWILILDTGSRYCQFLAGEGGKGGWLCSEVSSNRVHCEDDLLSPEDEFALLGLGYEVSGPNFQAMDEGAQVEVAADRTIACLRNVFRLGANDWLRIELFRSSLDTSASADT